MNTCDFAPMSLIKIFGYQQVLVVTGTYSITTNGYVTPVFAVNVPSSKTLVIAG